MVFLIISIQKSISEMMLVAERQAKLEEVNETIEQTVADRAAELTKEVLALLELSEEEQQRLLELMPPDMAAAVAEVKELLDRYRGDWSK